MSLNSPVFLSEQRSLEDLFFRMESPDREECESFKSLKSEVAFVGRVFLVYRPTGLNTNGTHRNPEILTRIKVLDFRASAKKGAEVDLEDLTTHEIMTVTYIPRRLFDYDVFVGVAHRQRLNWEGTLYQGQVTRKLSFMLIMKVRSPAENFSHSVTGIETPVKFRELFPDVNFTLNHTS